MGVADHLPDIANKTLLKPLKWHVRVTDGLHSHAFRVRQTDTKTGKPERFATPLFLALLPVFIGRKIFPVGIVGSVMVSRWKTRGQPALAGST